MVIARPDVTVPWLVRCKTPIQLADDFPAALDDLLEACGEQEPVARGPRQTPGSV